MSRKRAAAPAARSGASATRFPLLRRSAHSNGSRYAYADFFFGFGLVAFGAGCGSGLPSIEDSRPEVKV